jgi:hypothetical protein
MAQAFAVGVNHFSHAGNASRSCSRTGCMKTGHQHMHIATTGGCGSHGIEGGALDRSVIVFGNNKYGHEMGSPAFE